MARSWFGGDSASFVYRPFRLGGALLPSLVSGNVEIWTDFADKGGVRITDLLDENLVPVSVVVADASGQVPSFQGPDGVNDRVLATTDKAVSGVWLLNTDGLPAAQARVEAEAVPTTTDGIVTALVPVSSGSQFSGALAEAINRAPEMGSALLNNWTHPAAQQVGSNVIFGASSPSGDVVVGQLDGLTGRMHRYVVDTLAPADDHNCTIPSAASGHRTLVWWTNHSNDNQLRLRVSDPTGDISTLGAKQTFSAPDRVSYAQVWRDEDNPSTGWLFSRTMTLPEPLNFSWWAVRFTVDEATGTVTLGTWRELFKFPTGDQGYIITQRKSATELHIAIGGHPYVGSFHDVYYAVLNRVTGAVTAPETALSGNVLDGTGLPLSPLAAKKVWTAPTGKVCLMQDVRGTSDPAVLVTTATTGGNHDVQHVAYTTADDPGMSISAGGGTYARAFGTGGELDRASLKLRLLIEPTAWYVAGKAQRLAAKWSRAAGVTDSNFKSWMLTSSDNNNGRLRFVWSADGNATANTIVSTAAVPAGCNGVGLDFNPAGGSAQFYTTVDGGATWQTLGTANTFTASTMFQDSRTPVEVGGLPTADSFNIGTAGKVQRFTMYDAYNSSTAIADFYPASASQWVSGDGGGVSRPDSLGRTWELVGSVAITAAGWAMPVTIAQTGSGGSFAGLAPTMCYANPGRQDVVYVVVKNGTAWELRRLSRGFGRPWVSELVDTYDGLALARAKPVVDGNAVEVGYVVTDYYDDYFNFDGDTRFR